MSFNIFLFKIDLLYMLKFRLFGNVVISFLNMLLNIFLVTYDLLYT